eukprot:1711833-Lingulodinium_polyedra.AAC.1
MRSAKASVSPTCVSLYRNGERGLGQGPSGVFDTARDDGQGAPLDHAVQDCCGSAGLRAAPR